MELKDEKVPFKNQAYHNDFIVWFVVLLSLSIQNTENKIVTGGNNKVQGDNKRLFLQFLP